MPAKPSQHEGAARKEPPDKLGSIEQLNQSHKHLQSEYKHSNNDSNDSKVY